MPDLSLNPVYLSARAAIVAPERAIPTSIYSVQKWLPRLGPERWCLVMLLRALCIDAPRRTNGTKQIICNLQELAEALDLNKRTLLRWFEHEPIPNDDPWRRIVPDDEKTKYLALFIPRLRYAYETHRGTAKRVGLVLEILMEDPVVPEDEVKLKRHVEMLQLQQGEMPLNGYNVADTSNHYLASESGDTAWQNAPLEEEVKGQNVTLGESVKRQNVTLGESVKRQNVTLGESVKRQNVTLDESVKRQNVTSDESVKRQNVTSDESVKRQNVTLDESVKRQNVTLDESVKRQNVTLDESVKRQNVTLLPETDLPETLKRQNVTLDESVKRQNVTLDESVKRQNVTLDESVKRQNVTLLPETDSPETLKGQNVTSPETLKGQNVTLPETLKGQNVTSPETLKRQNVTSPETLKGQNVTSPETLKGQNVTSPETLKRQNVTSPETLKRQNVTSPETLKGQNVTSPETLKRQNVTSQGDLEEVKGHFVTSQEEVKGQNVTSQTSISDSVNVNVNMLYLFFKQLEEKNVNVNGVDTKNFEPIVTLSENLLNDHHSTAMLYKVLHALYPHHWEIYVKSVQAAVEAATNEPRVNKGAVFVRTLRDLAEVNEIDLGLRSGERDRKAAPREQPQLTFNLPIEPQETISPDKAIWLETQVILREQLPQATYFSVIQGTTLVKRDQEVFIIGVPTRVALDWLQHRLLTTVERVLKVVVGHAVSVEFILLEKGS